MEPSSLSYLLKRIKRGLPGYISYLAACDMNPSFSEYILYEPILRILTAQKCEVKCEVKCPHIPQPPLGDKKKLDFVVSGRFSFALEVKWTNRSRIDIAKDFQKLRYYIRDSNPGFLAVFGTRSVIENISFRNSDSFTERGAAVYADFGETKYSCRIYQVKSEMAL